MICNKYTLAIETQKLDLTIKRVRLELLRALESSKEWDGFDLKEYERQKCGLVNVYR